MTNSHLKKLGSALFLACAGTVPAYSQQPLPYFADGLIAVDATLDRQPTRFFYDTGASTTALFSSGIARLGIKSDAAGHLSIAGHATETRRTVPLEMAMFGQPATSTRLLVLPFPHAYDGVLSWSNVPATMMIDGFDRQIRALPQLPAPAGWQRWAMEPGNPQLFLAITRDGQPFGRVFIDTGVSGGLRLSPPLWQQWLAQNKDRSRTLETFRYAVGETMVNEVAWATEYRLGDLLLQNVDVGPIPTAKDGVALDKDGREFAATLGLQAFRHLRMIISPGTREVWTKAITGIPEHNRLGAVFLPQAGGTALMCRLSPGTPAAEAGLRDGDILVRADEEPFEPSSPAHGGRLQALFAQPTGTKLTLTVRRAGAELRIQATLRDLLR